MSWKTIFAAALVFLTVPKEGRTQTHAAAMWRVPMPSPSEVARAIEQGDTTKLWAAPAQILEAVRMAVPGAGIRDIAGLVGYVPTLDVRPCPSNGSYSLSRILLPSRTLSWFRRQFHTGETCFFDRNLGRYVMSTDCGNVIRNGFVSPAARGLAKRPPAPSQTKGVPRPAPAAQQTVVGAQSTKSPDVASQAIASPVDTSRIPRKVVVVRVGLDNVSRVRSVSNQVSVRHYP